jgi:hypothetical protein
MSEVAKKPLFWLAYYRGEKIGGVVVIESDSLISAWMNTLASRLYDGFTFAGGHALNAERAALVPQHAIGRMLTLAEAERLVDERRNDGAARHRKSREYSVSLSNPSGR